ncbi:hypothetical protein B9Z55_027994 [Caenorhabditis nigoni]|uniref:Uncharacterized protein n=1 Tax=Caenorhabditis nigoni TaxID=1611254 RepID=A0A2G5SE34_9PELO|nr:hypothetical protein B9Z55_027994 [Caenorhabditis nigoni]
MQNNKLLTNITYNTPPNDLPLSDWRRRKYFGVTYGTSGCLYLVSDFDGKCTVMVFNETSRTFCGRYRLSSVEGVPSTVISRSPNNFWIVTEEDRGRSRRNLRLYNIQMIGRCLIRVDNTDYQQSIRGNYQAMATDEDVLLVYHGSRPLEMDNWHPTFDQKTIKLVDLQFDSFMPAFTTGESLYAFKCNKNGVCDCTKMWEFQLSSTNDYPKKKEVPCAGVEIPTGIMKDRQSIILVHKTLMAITGNVIGGCDIWTMAIANQTWAKCTVPLDSENCFFTVFPSGVVYLCGINRNTGEWSFCTVDNMREELREDVRAYRRLDAADNSIQNGEIFLVVFYLIHYITVPLREKISWKVMIREAVKADPRKKATLREINCFVRKTFEMPPTFTKECVRRKIQANVVRGIANGTFRMTQGCGLKRHLRLVLTGRGSRLAWRVGGEDNFSRLFNAATVDLNDATTPNAWASRNPFLRYIHNREVIRTHWLGARTTNTD